MQNLYPQIRNLNKQIDSIVTESSAKPKSRMNIKGLLAPKEISGRTAVKAEDNYTKRIADYVSMIRGKRTEYKNV